MSRSERNENGKRLTGDIVMVDPQADIDGVQNTKERETPGNSVDDDGFALWPELIDDGAEEKQMDEGPDGEEIRSGLCSHRKNGNKPDEKCPG
jgi:hypothetical protein